MHTAAKVDIQNLEKKNYAKIVAAE